MKPTRFRYLRRFSLRSLFALMTLCCVVFGVWAAYVSPYRQQQRSLGVAMRLDGSFKVSAAEGPAWQGWLVTTMLGKGTFAQITEVDLSNKNVRDADLHQLAGLIHLRKISLDYTPLTNDGIAVLKAMRKL